MRYFVVTRRTTPNEIDAEIIKMRNGTLPIFAVQRNNPSFRKHSIALKIIFTLFNSGIFLRLKCHRQHLPLFRSIKGADITCRALLCSRAKRKKINDFSLARSHSPSSRRVVFRLIRNISLVFDLHSARSAKRIKFIPSFLWSMPKKREETGDASMENG